MKDWALEFPGAVTITDRDNTIIYMNEKSAKTFEKEGGMALLGKKLQGCHKEASIKIIEAIRDSGKPNIYTIEKQGVKKLIYQAPWRKNGEIAGLVELSLEIPFDMPHFKRG